MREKPGAKRKIYDPPYGIWEPKVLLFVAAVFIIIFVFILWLVLDFMQELERRSSHRLQPGCLCELAKSLKV